MYEHILVAGRICETRLFVDNTFLLGRKFLDTALSSHWEAFRATLRGTLIKEVKDFSRVLEVEVTKIGEQVTLVESLDVHEPSTANYGAWQEYLYRYRLLWAEQSSKNHQHR